MIVSIDAGTNTGVAIFCKNDKTIYSGTMKIHSAIFFIEKIKEKIDYVVLEDANLWKNFKLSSKESIARLQGAGSVKRDCAIWKEYFEDRNIKYQLIKPYPKLSSERFNLLTGCDKRTSQHERDAVYLIYNKVRIINNINTVLIKSINSMVFS